MVRRAAQRHLGTTGLAADVALTRRMALVQRIPSGTSNRFEKRLEGLRGHRALGLPVRFYFRRREQVLYLVVGGWEYGLWLWDLGPDAISPRRSPPLSRDRPPRLAHRRAERLHRLSIRGLSKPRSDPQGACPVLACLFPDAHREPGPCCRLLSACCPSTSTSPKHCCS